MCLSKESKRYRQLSVYYLSWGPKYWYTDLWIAEPTFSFFWSVWGGWELSHSKYDNNSFLIECVLSSDTLLVLILIILISIKWCCKYSCSSFSPRAYCGFKQLSNILHITAVGNESYDWRLYKTSPDLDLCKLGLLWTLHVESHRNRESGSIGLGSSGHYSSLCITKV